MFLEAVPRLLADPRSQTKEVRLVEPGGRLVAGCEQELAEKTGYITVTHNSKGNLKKYLGIF